MSDHTDQPNEAVVDGDQPTDQATTPLPLTLDEAALELGITVNAVRQRIKRGIDDEALALYLHGDWWIQTISR